MARPNSKYFASVIAKLIAAKRQEHIAIDQHFKIQLREELIQRASGSVLEEKETFDWGNFFRQWKYPLALVPSALLLMLVVSQVMELPVVMQSEVSVPLVSSQQETSDAGTENMEQVPESTEDTVVLQNNVLSQDSAATGLKPRMRTFPGSLVMPKKNLPALQETVPQVASPTLDVSGTVPVGTTGAQPSVATQPVVLPQPSVALEPAIPASSEELAKTVVDGLMPFVSTVIPDRTSEPRENTTTSHEEVKTTNDSGEKTDNGSTSTVTSDTPDQGSGAGLSQTSDTSSPTSGQSQPTAGETSDVSSTAGMFVQPDDRSAESTDELSYERAVTAEPDVLLNKVPVVPQAEPRAFPVFYQSDMTENDRVDFEKKVISGVIDSRDVSHAVVIRKDDGVIELQVFFEDSTSVTMYYQKNSKTGAWDTVEYVTRHYYDNSLKYTTDFRYLVPNR